MGRGALAAVALSVTVVGGAVLGTVAVVAGSSSASSFPPSASPVVATPTATTRGSGPAVAAASPPTGAEAARALPATSLPPAASPTSGASPAIDSHAIGAGFAGGYRFVAHLEGLPGLMSLGATVEGTVSNADHFVLDFPSSSFITRYTRHGATAEAIVNGRRVPVAPGGGTLGDISPEDLMPGRLWAQAVDPWEAALVADAAGRYAADTDVLVSHARQAGIDASRWQISAQTDGAGRLLTLAFSGAAWNQPFSLDLVVLYG